MSAEVLISSVYDHRETQKDYEQQRILQLVYSDIDHTLSLVFMVLARWTVVWTLLKTRAAPLVGKNKSVLTSARWTILLVKRAFLKRSAQRHRRGGTCNH
jgi:hypothetical protein